MTDDRELERFIDDALARLPQPQAPRTLRPRVMAAVATSGQRRGIRPWFALPLAWQAAALAVLVIAAMGLGMLAVSAVRTVVENNPGWLAGPTETARRLTAAADRVLVPGRVLWRAMVAPVAGYLAAMIVSMTLAFLSLGVALRRVVAGEFAQ